MPAHTGRAQGNLLLTALIGVLALPGCTGAEGSDVTAHASVQRSSRQITIAITAEPPVANPWLAPGAVYVGTIVFDAFTDPLVQLDDEGHWQPVIATRVPTLANRGVTLDRGGGMTVRLPLRPEASWSDGVPITCEDVAFTWKTVMTPRYQLSNRLGWDQIDRVACPDRKLAVIHLRRPYAAYTSRILAFSPLPAHELRGKDFNTYWNDRVTVSSGPYIFKRWQRGVKIVAERNPNWWRAGREGRPHADRLVFRFTKDANTMKLQLLMREIDVAFIPADTNLDEELSHTTGVTHSTKQGPGIEQLVLQTGRPPLNDPRVRRALGAAIDREMIARVVLKGQAPVMQSTIVPTAPVYESDAYAVNHPDRKRVAALLTDAGYHRNGAWWKRDGKTLTLTYVAAAGSVPFRARVAQLLQQQLEAAGIRLDIRLVAPQVLYTQGAPKGLFDIGEWSEPTGVDPLPSLLFACDQIPTRPRWAGKNRARYCSDDVDVLLRAADRTIDVTRRGSIIRDIDEQLAHDLPNLPLFRLPETLAWSTSVTGVRDNPVGGPLWSVDEWRKKEWGSS